MYMKIWGLEGLKEMGFTFPPYQVISINEDNPEDIEKYVLEKIKLVNVPAIKFKKNIYLEWSISQNGEIFYYEYLELPNA